MPINNDIVLINNNALRPAPKFTISNEKFTSGDYIIGGFIKVQLSGQLIGTSSNDLNSKISSKTSLHGTCVSITISCDGSDLINGSGFVRSINISPSDQPFMVTYTMDLEVTTNDGLKAIMPDAKFLELYGNLNIPDDIHLNSYEESLSLSTSDDLAKVGIYGSGTYSKPSVKLTGSITIQAYNGMCPVKSADNIIEDIFDIIENRAEQLLSLSPSLSDAYPILDNYIDNDWIAIHNTKSLNINKLDHKIEWRFDIFIYKGSCNPTAIVSIDTTESKDQSTGFETFILKGNIKGLSDAGSSIIDHSILGNSKINNAMSAYSNIISETIPSPSTINLIGCTAGVTSPPPSCYQRSSSQVTKNFNTGEITFTATYADQETCQLGGTSIDVSVTENMPARNQVTFIVPGQTPIVQISNTLTPYRVEISVSAKLNSCDTSKMGILIGCVNDRYATIIADYAGLLVEENSTTVGTYSYSRTTKFISC